MPPTSPDPWIEAQLRQLPEPLRALAALGRLRRFRKGTVILHEGTRGEEIYFLLQGSVRAYASDAGEREISFKTDRAGEYFGEMSLDGGPRPASVVAEETTVCAVVTRQVVWDQVARDPALARLLIEGLIGRIRWTTQRARELALYDVYGRLRRLLDSLAEPPDENGLRPISERITHQAIASRVGSSREMVSRLMKDLERGGYVRNTRASVTLLKALPARW
ncbi:MAG: Crp/Fnr family transcriptional regulator [Rubrivivax sp.]